MCQVELQVGLRISSFAIFFILSLFVKYIQGSNVVLVLYYMQCIATRTVFECTVLSEPVIQLSIQMVSLVSFLLNQPFEQIWMIQWVIYKKQGLVPTYWQFYCHIYLSMTDLKISTKTHSAKYCLIMNNDQNSSTSGPRRRKKTYK